MKSERTKNKVVISPKKILIIKQTSLGDVLHITPVIREIKNAFPDTLIDIVIDKKAVPILEHHPAINKLYVVDIYNYQENLFRSPKYFASILKEIATLIRTVRKTKYDLAIDLQGLMRSSFFLYTARAHVRAIKGRWFGVSPLYYTNLHAIEGYLQALKFLGITSNNTSLDFFLDSKSLDRTLAEKNIFLPKTYLVYSPYSRWPTKNIPISTSISILKELRRQVDIAVFITATSEFIEQATEIATAIPNAISLAGTISLSELGYIISKASGMICVDSFPMHAATAFNIPLVALFGPTNENLVGPLSAKSLVIRNQKLPCKMCYRRSCANHLCFSTMDSAEIIENLLKVMRETSI